MAISGKIILIAGGIGKDADFTLLRESIAKYTRALVLIGKDAKLIGQALAGVTKVFYASSGMAEAVAVANRLALPQDVVLLSPACASFDLFNNFEHRGEIFTAEVKKLLMSTDPLE